MWATIPFVFGLCYAILDIAQSFVPNSTNLHQILRQYPQAGGPIDGVCVMTK